MKLKEELKNELMKTIFELQAQQKNQSTTDFKEDKEKEFKKIKDYLSTRYTKDQQEKQQ